MRTNHFCFVSAILVVFFGRIGYARQESAQISKREIGQTKLNVTEQYSAESRRVLEDYLKDHPKIAEQADPAVFGRDNEFKVIIPTEGNLDTTVNVNLFVTVTKGYVRLTREQKSAQIIVPVLRAKVRPSRSGEKQGLKFDLEGVVLPENIFIRVTDGPDLKKFLNNDDYYFIASESSYTEQANVERVDPVDLILRPGSDSELKHFGIEPPSAHDYLPKEVVVGEPHFPELYPRTNEILKGKAVNIDARNLVRWQRFCDELYAKRRSLKLNGASKVLQPELYYRYHPANIGTAENRSVTHRLGTDEYLAFEWGIRVPIYRTMKQPVNVPVDYNEAFRGYVARVGRDNSEIHAANTDLWNQFATTIQAKLPNPYYSTYYYRHQYTAKFESVIPGINEQDDPPRRGSMAELRAHGIAQLPGSYHRLCLLQGMPFPSNGLQVVRPANIPEGEFTRQLAALNEYNKKVSDHNEKVWSSFEDQIKSAGLRLSDYEGKIIAGQTIWRWELVSSVRQFNHYFYYNPAYALPEIQGD